MPRSAIHFDLVVALGNPGVEYEGTRHNAGFAVADAFARTCEGISSEFKIAGAAARRFVLSGCEVHLLKPNRYMNLSGEPVAAFIAKKGLAVERMMLVHDDMDIPLGRMKLCLGAGAAGHNGVQSVIDCVGSANFARLRIGIGRGGGEGADYVLSKFTGDEEEIFRDSVELCVSAIRFSLASGISAAMNKFNRRPAGNSSGKDADEDETDKSEKKA